MAKLNEALQLFDSKKVLLFLHGMHISRKPLFGNLIDPPQLINVHWLVRGLLKFFFTLLQLLNYTKIIFLHLLLRPTVNRSSLVLNIDRGLCAHTFYLSSCKVKFYLHFRGLIR